MLSASGSDEILDFNSSTGNVTHPITITSFAVRPYGVEFSPDGSKFYASAQVAAAYGPGEVYQYNLLAGSDQAIKNSGISISKNNGERCMQLATDGKIYIANHSPIMPVINDPNALGINCNFSSNGFSSPSTSSPSGTTPGSAHNQNKLLCLV